MIQLEDFLQLAMENYYKINLYDNETGKEILHQIEICNIIKELEKIKKLDLMLESVSCWDINERNELTISVK